MKLMFNKFRRFFWYYFSSTSEFAVSTRILRNATLATRVYHNDDFEVLTYFIFKNQEKPLYSLNLRQLLGSRGNNSQSTIHGFDLRTRTIFFASFVKSGISCWNLMNRLSEDNIDLVFQNNETLFYPSDLKVIPNNYIGCEFINVFDVFDVGGFRW